MHKAVIFGGTTEGRKLCEVCAEHSVSAICCVATAYGARPLRSLPGLETRIGRLGAAEMASLLEHSKPALCIDATHQYSDEASENIGLASQAARVPLLRVMHEHVAEQGLTAFDRMSDLLSWLEQEQGNIFVTLGASYAKAFSRLNDYQNRVWFRILPYMDSLRICLDLGYRPERLICMQGPFLEDLNRAMFQRASARILVTKDSGIPGGFSEKVRAAQSLGMVTAALSKPKGTEGVSLEEASAAIMNLCK